MIALSALFGSIAAYSAPAEDQDKLPFTDESDRNPSLVRFLNQLRETVRTKNSAGLLRVVAPDVLNNFGGDDGIEGFKLIWHPERPDSRVWPLLEKLLKLGGAWVTDVTYYIPYVYPKFPPTDDPYYYEVVVAENVWLLVKPNETARRIRKLSYDVVRLQEDGAEWHKVMTEDGDEGYIQARFLHSPVGYRARINRDASGQWKITALVAGD